MVVVVVCSLDRWASKGPGLGLACSHCSLALRLGSGSPQPHAAREDPGREGGGGKWAAGWLAVGMNDRQMDRWLGYARGAEPRGP